MAINTHGETHNTIDAVPRTLHTAALHGGQCVVEVQCALAPQPVEALLARSGLLLLAGRQCGAQLGQPGLLQLGNIEFALLPLGSLDLLQELGAQTERGRIGAVRQCAFQLFSCSNAVDFYQICSRSRQAGTVLHAGEVQYFRISAFWNRVIRTVRVGLSLTFAVICLDRNRARTRHFPSHGRLHWIH
jgi:hypothetical protein